MRTTTGGAVHRFWVNPTKRRYYRVLLERDLFGALVLRRIWGSLDSKLGGMRCEQMETVDAGLATINSIAARRQQHGYEEREICRY